MGRTGAETARHQKGGGDVQDGRTRGEAGRHPEDSDVLRGRARGESSRNREGRAPEITVSKWTRFHEL